MAQLRWWRRVVVMGLRGSFTPVRERRRNVCASEGLQGDLLGAASRLFDRMDGSVNVPVVPSDRGRELEPMLGQEVAQLRPLRLFEVVLEYEDANAVPVEAELRENLQFVAFDVDGYEIDEVSRIAAQCEGESLRCRGCRNSATPAQPTEPKRRSARASAWRSRWEVCYTAGFPSTRNPAECK